MAGGAARWGWSRGLPLGTVRELAEYRRTTYDRKVHEAWNHRNSVNDSDAWMPERGTVTGVLVSAHDATIRWVERNPDVVRWNELNVDGHFLAIQEPEMLIDDVLALFRQVAGDG